jgi:hypothetical protein
MNNILENLKIINQADTHQQGKIKYKLNEIIGITFFTMAAGANDFIEIAAFTKVHKQQLQKHFTLQHGTPSHDTIQRTFAMLTQHTYKNPTHNSTNY